MMIRDTNLDYHQNYDVSPSGEAQDSFINL